MSAPSSPFKLRVLVAPLDWGLGHATRCIPIVNALLSARAEVVLAGDGRIASLLKTEFPHLLLLPLQGYNVKYGKTRLSLLGKMVLHIPNLLKIVEKEHLWLQEVCKEHRFDVVISDNRYGLFTKSAHCILITHQLLIQTGLGGIADRLLQKIHYKYINRFNECWIPDHEQNGIAGVLSHPKHLPAIPTRYIGTLSRFSNQTSAKEDHVLILLSGPEPQRTILENSILKQLETYHEPVLLVRGLPGKNEELLNSKENIRIANHLPAAQLELAINSASFVVARCGYSTVMDVLTLKKKSILIPTPGQTEQEYLAKYLMEQGYAWTVKQSGFQLKEALTKASLFHYNFPEVHDEEPLKLAIKDLLLGATKRK